MAGYFIIFIVYSTMGVEEKKNQVLLALSKTNDEAVIDDIYELFYPSVSDADVNNLPQPLQQKINKALEDYKSGNYITHSQMKEKLQQWLTK